MRSAAIAACLMLVLASWPAHAQLFPTGSTPVATEDRPAERTLIDATLFVEPPNGEGLCIGMGPGQVAITVKRVADAIEGRPARFGLYGFMADPDTHVEIPVSRVEVTTSTHVNGSDHYCWSVTVDAPETTAMSRAQRGAYVQLVDVRIVHRPD